MKTKKLALVGYGKMGKLIEKLAPDHGYEVCSRISSQSKESKRFTKDDLQGAEVVIEFTAPDAAPKNLLLLAELGLPTVCGTTGWFAQLPEIKAAFENSNTTLIYGSNFSVGVNLFDRLIREAGRLFAKYPGYSAWAWEAHHLQKKDAPSGTLLKLVDSMKLGGFSDDIDISSTRAGFITGTHEIGFDSLEDTINLRHTAKNRDGFAKGALFGAQMALNKSGVFEFSEVLFDEK